MTPEAIIALPIAIAAIGAATDIVKRKLPNVLCTALMLASLLSLGVIAGLTALPWGLLHGVVALLVGMGLFAIGWIGGGDAKFYAAGACAIPIFGALTMLLWTSLAGLGLLVAMAVARVATGKAVLKKGGWSVPYGVAIAGGLAAALLV